jgi:nucleoside-diphosphate-sugar epimerase
MQMTSNPKTIAILGANGRLGRMAARAVADAGWRVRAINRAGRGDIAGIEYKAADATVTKSLIDATAGCDFLFNGLNPKYTNAEWKRLVLPLARNAIAAAKANGLVHLFPGNVYNFGSAIPEHPTEETRFVGDHAKAAVRIEAEALFENAARVDGVKTLILRAGDFFGGDGRGSWFDLVIAKDIAKGKFTWPGSREIIHAWAYLPDLARAFVALAEHADELPAFARFHFEGHNVTGNEMHAAAEAAVGRKLKPASLPLPLMRMLGWFSPTMAATSEMAYLWRRPHRLTGEKLQAAIGPLPHTPLDQAVAEALGDLGIRAAMPARAAMRTLAA